MLLLGTEAAVMMPSAISFSFLSHSRLHSAPYITHPVIDIAVHTRHRLRPCLHEASLHHVYRQGICACLVKVHIPWDARISTHRGTHWMQGICK